MAASVPDTRKRIPVIRRAASYAPSAALSSTMTVSDVRLVARDAEHAVQPLVAQMVEHGQDEPRVGEEQLRGAEPGA